MTLKQTILHDRHVDLGARMVEFAGWSMPVQYAGALAEHRAVRTGVGVFDVGHMGTLLVHGAGAATALDALTVWPMSKLKPGRAKYTVMLDDDGGTVDDLIVYRRGEADYFIIWNAGNHAKNLTWTAETFAAHDAIIDDRTDATALIAVQGSNWRTVVEAALADTPLPDKRFGFCENGNDAAPTIVARTGYTGEDGVEIWLPNERAGALWDRLLAAGAKPCGLAARDALRIEAGLPLYGHELSNKLDPYQGGVGFTVKLDERDFRGRQALEARRQAPQKRGVVGLVLEQRGVPREGYTVLDAAENEIGHVTSGTYSPIVEAGVALALLVDPESRYDEAEARGFVVIRNKQVPVRFAKPPLHTASRS